MKHNATQALSWLHTWSGLLVGWLLFVIFAGGTIACFDKELDYWMQPSLHGRAMPQTPSFDKAVEHLQKTAPDAHSWYLLVGDRDPALQAYTFMDDGTETRVALDPVTGDVLPSTAGGDFFFTLHYNLHAGNLGMYIVGLAGMLAFAAIIAGILIHKRFFKDFFTFRPAAGKQRAWLDAHNLTGVLGLPFHLLISYTGVIIFATSYMFAGVNAGYGGDINKLYTEAGDFYEREEVGKPLGKMTSTDALLDRARAELGTPITWASIHHPHDASATIALGGDHSRHVAWNFHQATYDAADGRLLHVTKPPAAGYHTYEFLGGLHMVQFGGSLVRWLYFILGLAGCVMIASGMQVWVRKRLKRVREAGAVSGYGLVRALNVGVVAGFPFAATAMLLANRLLPWSLADRASAEVAVFCMAWIGATVWGALADRVDRGWRDLFAATAAAFALVPIVNAVATPNSALWSTLRSGDLALAAVDLTCLVFALTYAWMARRAARTAPMRAEEAFA